MSNHADFVLQMSILGREVSVLRCPMSARNIIKILRFGQSSFLELAFVVEFDVSGYIVLVFVTFKVLFHCMIYSW